jgi:FkbM family methyltransferase
VLNALRDKLWTARHARADERQRARRRHAQREFYGALLPAGATVFDVGANVGERVEAFLAVGARVVAFEPQPVLAQALRARFPGCVVREVALGAQHGTAVLRIADESTISTMSDEWREAVVSSGRFADHTWPEQVEVEVSTLDAEIAAAGLPDFCKIDVEGYEREVLAGLSHPVPLLSFEFTAELGHVALECVQLLDAVGRYEFAFSPAETMRLWEQGWLDGAAAATALQGLPGDLPWGDVYARLRQD